MSKVTTSDRLNTTRAALATAEEQTRELDTQRAAALLADDDKAAVKLFGELEKLRAAIAGYRDKLELLEQELAREAEAERAREREARLRKFKELANTPEACGVKLQEAVAAVEREYRATLEARAALHQMWPRASSHMDAVAINAGGVAFTSGAIRELLEYEFYRVSKQPPSAEPGAPAPPSLPGSRAPSLNLLGNPGAILPLSEKLKQAGAFAVQTLRSGAFVPPPVPQPEVVGSNANVFFGGAPEVAPSAPAASAAPAAQPAPRAVAPTARPAPSPTFVAGTEDTKRMTELSMRLASLANDVSPQGEIAYQNCLKEIRQHEEAMRAKMAVA